MNMPRLAQQVTSAYLGQLSSVANIWLGRLGDDPRALKELWRELPLPRTLDQENACSELSKALHSSSPVLALRDIEYHKAEHEKELERTAGRNRWVAQLRESIGPQPAGAP